ncbi:MAG: N-acetylglucosamine kinase [Cyclobacteriaceae bacterium]|nr:N-acetylglucosamine kinase [Cyclobacteriaceae bacterium HetDA_MAG_MS6]
MKLIGDAGGTSTDWRLLDGDDIRQFKTVGFNVNSSSLDGFSTELQEHFQGIKFDEIHLYIAGLPKDDPKHPVRSAIHQTLQVTNVYLYNDMLGAGQALYLKDAGWVGILGTGSGLAYYDGTEITKRIPGLGYILGDEGSGADIGARLLKDFLRDQMPEDIKQRFSKRFEIDERSVLKSIYEERQGGKYFGNFSKFAFQNRDTSYCYQLLVDAFSLYFDTYFKNEELTEPVNFSGSVAFYYSDILRRVASDKGVFVGKILESPIAGLTLYHQ